MRHKKSGRKFGRERGHRGLMLNNLVISLVEHGRINTTVARAKEIRGIAERLITYAKKDTIHYRRLVFKTLRNRDLVKKMFDEIAPQYIGREGGYTRVLKNGYRTGDCSPMAIIEFVEGSDNAAKKDDIKTKDIAK